MFRKLKTEKVLKAYKEHDYDIRKRAFFLYYFLIAGLAVSVFMLFSMTYLQLTDPRFEQLQYQTLSSIFALSLALTVSMISLVKGQFNLAANILMLSALTAIWIVILFDKSRGIGKINTIVFIFTVLAMLPLIIKSKKTIWIYGASNLILFLAFMIWLYPRIQNYQMTVYDFKDTVIDVTAAMCFLIVILYNVYSINYVALTNAKEEIEQRKKIAEELQFHKDNLETLVKEKTEDLEVAVEELKSTNEELHNKSQIIHDQNLELKTALEHLKETQAQLVQAEKMASLGILTAGVAHEINNPLNFMMGAYEALETYFENHGSHDEELTNLLLTSIREGIDRTESIVKSLNYFSRDNSTFDEDCEIHTILDNCLIILNNQLKHRIEILKEYESKELIIKGNVGKLHQAFLNVLANAIQAIEKEGSIQIRTEGGSQKILVCISDSGCGIDSKNIKQLTDPFYTTKPPGEGVGLGLSITYSIIKEHKGSIEFQSELGQGTKVIIRIPYKTE